MIALLSLFFATAEANPVSVGGYMRVMTRPDLQGGSGTLGYWNLYGRLLNERPYASLDLKMDLLPNQQNNLPWTSLYTRIEGNSIRGADAQNGSMQNFRLSQVYLLSGNVGIKNVQWRVGTQESFMGDLGLYDMRPSEIFFGMVGVSGRYQTERMEIILGAGDSGYSMLGTNYNTIFTGGGSFRLRPVDGFEFGVGGQYNWEKGIQGNRNSPYLTPSIAYEDFARGEVVQNYMQENPYQAQEFPDPVLSDADSYKAVGYLGFGGFGPLIWNNFYATYQKLHPEKMRQEEYQGQLYDIFTTGLTDQRTVLLFGNEMQLKVIPKRFDIAWGVLYGDQRDGDNNIAPSDYDRIYKSTVLRSQLYLTPTLHFLLESSIASEYSRNGNAYREHADSLFSNTEGSADTRGFENGDADTRITWQGKTGIILNPTGIGIFARPSLRILYGSQYSNQNNAFGNSFVETVNQYNDFGNVEQHWHHLFAVETEAWF